MLDHKTDDTAIYLISDIMRLFACSYAEVPRLVREGVIPKPLPRPPRGKMRWAKATVNRRLGLPVAPPNPDIESMIREEVRRAMRGIRVVAREEAAIQ